MSEDSNFFIYTRDGNNQVEKHAIIPFVSLVPLGEKYFWQTNDTCQTNIFWQAYFNFYTKHDIPSGWDGIKSPELQDMKTYTEFKNAISVTIRGYEKPSLKFDIFPIKFLDYSSSFHRTIINFLGRNDNDTYGLTDEPYDVNLTKEFINGTGYDIEQLVSEEKLYHNDHIHNEQFRNNTYVWFNQHLLGAFDETTNLQYFFKVKRDYIKAALEKANLRQNEDESYNFSSKENREEAKAVLTSAGINIDFDSVFNNYDERLTLTGVINKLDEFINDLSEYLTFQSFCGHYIASLDSDWRENYRNPQTREVYGLNPIYLLQSLFTQITMDYLDEPAEVRKQIFDGIVKIRQYLWEYLGEEGYIDLYTGRYCGPQKEMYAYFKAYNPTENPIQYIVNSILPENLRLTGEKFDLFIKHINYMYTALINLSPDASVTRLTLWTIPQTLDKKFGFIRDGVFCRTLFDVVEKYNSITKSERITNDLKEPPKEYEILTAKEVQKLSEPPEITSNEEKTSEQEESQQEDEISTTEEIQKSPEETETITSEEETAEPENTTNEEETDAQEKPQQEDETLTTEEIQNLITEPENIANEEETNRQEEFQQENETSTTEETQNLTAEPQTIENKEETNEKEKPQQENKQVQKLPEIQTKLEMQKPSKRKCIKISGITATILGFLMLALGASAQIISFGIPNPISIAFMAVGGAFIASGSGALVYRACKNKQEETLISDSKDDDNTQPSMDSIDDKKTNMPFLTPERREQAKAQAKTLEKNQTTNPTIQPTL